ncbi:hypothetical protein MMIC_P1229 [Mariprofundus micogutta]|uniref:Uncharacterized protein n=1 Tax=Mariprofundus micogutta TaxID=1921010 RepID=A0A1L8CMW9_9PROT|nr:hypothetical protein [Mariprofundus micogutta]GAV20265.1 hypothetical protein MMIC_P1229 [Mariprofundus micogutta]
MSNISFADAFGKYSAKLKNVQWSVCAINEDDELVISLWEHHIDKNIKDKLVFEDFFDRWSGPGNNEFRTNVSNAYKTNQNVRLILVVTKEVNEIQNGNNASTVKKSFRVLDHLIGRVTEIDGEKYTISFKLI